MAPLPDAKHLLELLQRAADELKASQAEVKGLQERLSTSDAALAEEKRQRKQLSDQLMDIGSTTLPPNSLRAPEFTVKTVPLAKMPAGATDLMRPREEKTSVGNGDDGHLLGDRVRGLEAEVQQLDAERKQLKERLKALEAELVAPNPDALRKQGEMEHELSNTRQQLIVEQARGADLLTRLQAWEKRSQELEQSLASSRTAGEEEHAQLEGLAGQLSQVETELTTERARTQAMEEQLRSLEQGSSDEQKRLFEATSRVAQLEVEVSGLRGRRDELNVEIGKVENERNAARARAAELETAAERVREQLTAEHAAAAETERLKRSELEQQVAREKDKHQITAQKLLEARGKGKELDEKLHAGAAQVAELEARLAAAAVAQEEAVARLTVRVTELVSQLETATNEWHHTDRQYEQLHKEMLVILDQRDEARREMETIKQRLGLR